MYKPKILLVEDRKGIREVISIILRDEYRLIETASAQEGLALFQKYKPALVITDNKTVGDMTGLELIAQIKQQDPIMPIIMISASDVEEKAQSLGAYGFLSKPFDVHILIDLVKQAFSTYNQTIEAIQEYA